MSEPDLEAKLDRSERELDAFDAALGLPGVGPDEVSERANALLSMPPSALAKMGAVECGEAAVCLAQFAFRLQRAQNREQARMSWAEESVRLLVAGRTGGSAGSSHEERRARAVREHPLAARADAVRVRARLRLERVSYLAARADGLAKALMSLQNAKRNQAAD